MKAILIFALLAAAVQCGSIADAVAQGRDIFRQNACFKERLESELLQLQVQIGAMKLTQQDGAVFDAAFEQTANKLIAAFGECGVMEGLEVGKFEWLEILGNVFVLGSQCFKQIGTFLVLGDTIIQDPNNITNTIVIALLLVFVARAGYNQCSAFIEYIDNIIHPNATMIATQAFNVEDVMNLLSLD